MSDFRIYIPTRNGFTPDEFDRIAIDAKETIGGLFLANPCELGHEDCVEIFRKSFR